MRGDYRTSEVRTGAAAAGPWPANKNDIGIERMAAQYNQLGIGDPITFKIGNQERTLSITSLIRHPFVPPPQFEDLAFFFMERRGPGAL